MNYTEQQEWYFEQLIHWLIDSVPPDLRMRDRQLRIILQKVEDYQKTIFEKEIVLSKSTSCGKKIGDKSMYCKNCGKAVPDDAVFCPFCGIKLQHHESDLSSLVKQIQQSPSDQDAITSLYKQTYKSAYSCANALLKGDDEIFDVIQNAFLKALNNINSLTSEGSFLPWYKQIVRNTALDYLKKSNRIVFESSLPDEDEEGGDNSIFDSETPLNISEQKLIESQIEEGEIKNLVRDVIKSLPQDQQTMVGLRYYYDMKEKDIASELGVAESTVKSGLFRARKSMKKSLEAYSKRTGTKLYSIAPVPFLLWLFAKMDSQAYAVPVNTHILDNIIGIRAAETGASAAASDTAKHAAEKTVKGTVQKEAVKKAAEGAGKAAAGTAAKAAGTKVITCVLVAAVAGGGTAAAIHHQITQNTAAAEEITMQGSAGTMITEEKVPEEAADIVTTEEERPEASYLIDGESFNNTLITIAKEQPEAENESEAKNLILSIDHSETAPEESDNPVTVSESGAPTYLWYQDGHIMWYSEAQTVYLNESAATMFDDLPNCQNIDITGMDTSNVTDMSLMFSLDPSLHVDLSKFDTSNVTNMQFMFTGSNIEGLDLSGFDMSNVQDTGDQSNTGRILSPIHCMFEDATGTLGKWWNGVTDAQKAETFISESSDPEAEEEEEETIANKDDNETEEGKTGEISEAFLVSGPEFNQDIYNLPGITTAQGENNDVIDNIYSVVRTDTAPGDQNSTIQVSESGSPVYMWLDQGTLYLYTEADTMHLNKDCSEMFGNLLYCANIDLTGIDTSDVENMDGMFYADVTLQSIDLSGFDTSKVISFQSMFANCENLQALDLSGFDTSSLPATDIDDPYDSPLAFMLFDCNADVTWWNGATEGEKEAATLSP